MCAIPRMPPPPSTSTVRGRPESPLRRDGVPAPIVSSGSPAGGVESRSINGRPVASLEVAIRFTEPQPAATPRSSSHRPKSQKSLGADPELRACPVLRTARPNSPLASVYSYRRLGSKRSVRSGLEPGELTVRNRITTGFDLQIAGLLPWIRASRWGPI